MRLIPALAVLWLPAVLHAQIRPFSGVNGLGHSTYYCLDGDGDGYGIGPLAFIDTSATAGIGTGVQTVIPANMTGGAITGTLVNGSAAVTMPNSANGVPQTNDLLQIGETVSGTGLTAGTTIAAIAQANAPNTGDPVRITLSAAATVSATESLTIGIGVGTVLRIGTVNNMERVVTTEVTATTFTADFLISHPSGTIISDQGCLGWDPDDNDPLVWTQTQIIDKYEGGTSGTSFPHFRQKMANDLLLEKPGATADIQAFAAVLKSPTTIFYLAPATATPAGSDSNSATGCAITAPCLTVAGLASAGYSSSSSGVLVFMRNGWSGRIQPPGNGTSVAPNIWMSYPGELASLIPNGDLYDNTVELSDVSWVYLRDLQLLGGAYIDGQTTVGSPTPPAITFHDVLLQNIDARGPFGNGGGLYTFDLSNVSVDHSAFYDDVHDHGIYAGSRSLQSANVVFQRLLLHHNEWNGLHFNGRCSGCMVQQTVSFANGISGLDFEMGWNHSTVQSNLVFSVGKGITFYDYESGQCPGRVSKSDFTGTVTTGTNTISVSSVSGLVGAGMQVGDEVDGTGIPSGDTITALDSTTNKITLLTNATASASETLSDEKQYQSGQVQICPYDENYNVIANNTVVLTGNDASTTFDENSPCGQIADCGGGALLFTNATEIATTGNQQQAGNFDHETIVNNILENYGDSDIDPPMIVGDSNDANDPYGASPISCDANCQNWLATDSVQHNLFFQNDGTGNISILRTYGPTVVDYNCSTAASVIGSSGGAFSGCVFGDPKFASYDDTDYTNDSLFDLRLLADSPALHAGIIGNVPAYDLVGRAFLDNAPAIGAVERNPWKYGWNDLGAATAMGPGVCPPDGAPNGTNTIAQNGTADTSYPFQLLCPAEIRSWTDGVMRDSAGKPKQLVWFGGGHGDYNGNEVYAVSFNTANPSIARVSGPSTLAGDPGSGATFSTTVDGSGHVSIVTLTGAGTNYLGSVALSFTPTGGDIIDANCVATGIATVKSGAVASVLLTFGGCINHDGDTGYMHVPTVTTLSAPDGPSIWNAPPPGVPELADGAANSRHTTGSMSYDPDTDKMLVFDGAIVNGPHFNDTWNYDLGSHAWERLDPTACASGCGGRDTVGAQIDPTLLYGVFDSDGEYNPIQKNFFYLWDTSGATAIIYDPATNTWTSHGHGAANFFVDGADADYGPMRAIIPDRQLFFVMWAQVSPDNQDAGKFDLSQITSNANAWGSSAFTDISTAIDSSCNELYLSVQQPIVSPAPAASSAPGFTWNQAIGKIVGYPANSGGTFYEMDPDSLKCTTTTLPNGPAAASNPYIYGRMRYSPSVDATILVQDYGEDAYALSLNAPDPGSGSHAPVYSHSRSGNFRILGASITQ